MKVLELFSGTHSVGKVCKERGWDVLSLDSEVDADIRVDIMEWDYTKYKPGDFDIVWASPPCRTFSRLRSCNIGRRIKEHGDTVITREIIESDMRAKGLPLLYRTLDIIFYLEPKYWFIENPYSSKMKQFMTGVPRYVVDYCKYSDWGYKKRTNIWTNVEGFTPKLCRNDCENIITIPTLSGDMHTGYNTPIKGATRTLHLNPIGSKDKLKIINERRIHARMVDGGYDKRKPAVNRVKGTTTKDRGRVPAKLIEDLFDACDF